MTAYLNVIQPVGGFNVGQPFTVIYGGEDNLTKFSQAVNEASHTWI